MEELEVKVEAEREILKKKESKAKEVIEEVKEAKLGLKELELKEIVKIARILIIL